MGKAENEDCEEAPIRLMDFDEGFDYSSTTNTETTLEVEGEQVEVVDLEEEVIDLNELAEEEAKETPVAAAPEADFGDFGGIQDSATSDFAQESNWDDIAIEVPVAFSIDKIKTVEDEFRYNEAISQMLISASSYLPAHEVIEKRDDLSAEEKERMNRLHTIKDQLIERVADLLHEVRTKNVNVIRDQLADPKTPIDKTGIPTSVNISATAGELTELIEEIKRWAEIERERDQRTKETYADCKQDEDWNALMKDIEFPEYEDKLSDSIEILESMIVAAEEQAAELAELDEE